MTNAYKSGFKQLNLIQKILVIVIIGLLANLFYDLYNVVLLFLYGVSLDWHLIGRWVLHILHGDFIFRHIPQSDAMTGEKIFGWAIHYATAIVYAAIFVILIQYVFKSKYIFIKALIFTWICMLIPFLILKPAMGAGYFGSLTPNQAKSILMTFSFHSVFGIGLYLSYTSMIRLISKKTAK